MVCVYLFSSLLCVSVNDFGCFLGVVVFLPVGCPIAQFFAFPVGQQQKKLATQNKKKEKPMSVNKYTEKKFELKS